MLLNFFPFPNCYFILQDSCRFFNFIQSHCSLIQKQHLLRDRHEIFVILFWTTHRQYLLPFKHLSLTTLFPDCCLVKFHFGTERQHFIKLLVTLSQQINWSWAVGREVSQRYSPSLAYHLSTEYLCTQDAYFIWCVAWALTSTNVVSMPQLHWLRLSQ